MLQLGIPLQTQQSGTLVSSVISFFVLARTWGRVRGSRGLPFPSISFPGPRHEQAAGYLAISRFHGFLRASAAFTRPRVLNQDRAEVSGKARARQERE